MKISGYVITYNEEHHIEECLKTLNFCDEIVVVDSNSTDTTIEKIKSYAKKNKKIPIKIFNQSFLGFIKQKNYAVEKTKYEWVFNIDADERVSPELYKSFEEVKKNSDQAQYEGVTSFSMNRRSRYIDTWVKYCGWYPDTKIRFFNKKYGKWDGDSVHEWVNISGKNQHLEGDLMHYTFMSLSDHIRKMDKYTTFAAEEYFKAGKTISFAGVFIRMFTTFIRSYFVKLGFLDGKTGFVISIMSAYHTMLKYAKLWYLVNEKKD